MSSDSVLPLPENPVIVGFGGVGVDLLATVESFPKPDTKNRTTQLKVHFAPDEKSTTIEQEGVSRIVKVFWWCIEPFSPKMDIKFRSIMLPLMAGWMLGFISLMGIPFQDTVKSISWTLAIFLLISIFFWLMTFIGSFVVSMAILLQWEDVNFKAIVLLVIPLIAGFGYGIAACLCRAMTYNVHGVNGAVIFSIGSVVVTLLIAFSAFVGRRFGLCDKVKEVWIYLRGY